MNDKTYDYVKQAVRVGIPGFGTLYFTLAAIWNLPHADQVVGTCTALTTFLGIVLNISDKRYNAEDQEFDGSVLVSKEKGGRKLVSFHVDAPRIEDTTKDRVVFKIVDDPDQV